MYFFRDENGGCALFDALGPPWPIHDCWKDHARQSRISKAIERSLESVEFDGNSYQPQGLKVTEPREGAYELALTGFVADNCALYQPPRLFPIHSYRHVGSLPLVIVAIDAGGRLYPFMFSVVSAKEVPNYSFVEIKGTWRKKGRYWYLLTTSFRRIEPNHQRKDRLRSAITGTCTYCGLPALSCLLVREGKRPQGRRRIEARSLLETVLSLHDGGFGFIRHPEYPNNVFFHRRSLNNRDFADLKQNLTVIFDVLTDPKGPIATNIDVE